MRKSIATVLTVLSHHQRSEVAKLYVDKKYKPLDLREKTVHPSQIYTCAYLICARPAPSAAA